MKGLVEGRGRVRGGGAGGEGWVGYTDGVYKCELSGI